MPALPPLRAVTSLRATRAPLRADFRRPPPVVPLYVLANLTGTGTGFGNGHEETLVVAPSRRDLSPVSQRADGRRARNARNRAADGSRRHRLRVRHSPA
jgi:hypothetical protein